MANLGIAGGAGNAGVIFTREADARNAGNHVHIAAGQFEVVKRAAPIGGDPDESLNLIKNLLPRGLAKAEYVVDERKPNVENERITGPASVTDLIRKAMQTPGSIEDLERGYTGRELSQIVKAAEAAPKEVTSDDLDHASPLLRKVLSDFNEMVKRQVARRPV